MAHIKTYTFGQKAQASFFKKHSFDSQLRKGRSYLQSDEKIAACGTGGSRRCLPWTTKGQGSRTVRRRSTSGPTSSNSEDELEILGDECTGGMKYAYTHGLRTLICHYTRAVRDSTARVSASDSGANPRSIFLVVVVAVGSKAKTHTSHTCSGD